MIKKLNFIVVVIALMIISAPGYAEDIYVTGVTNITMRTGPGTSNKIVAMLKSGTKLEIIEYQKDWSQVKTARGKQGWVLSRFLTQKIPDALLVDKLNKENEQLQDRLAELEEANRTLTVKNASLVKVEDQYRKLKKESKQYLDLQARYAEISKAFESHKNKIERLESESHSEIQMWYLIGPGVLIVGFIFGLSTRKRRRSSLL